LLNNNSPFAIHLEPKRTGGGLTEHLGFFSFALLKQ
jgi:hypothetical protein